ncbi:lipopolysaccharide biosynthesis protein [Parabacteroides bouchesdurhonensis]|uniref:lipopolysaccharide biosynthesis protein n=1 Tax=Parabacteroides bouchesdurhonensis TaxID=1936995 RepID=UPI000E54D4FD|nr:lipopolysaccharide biosynthesis protein [Parabacteroides bouchesdurhonensis]RHJ90400.1 lipopolysaccharide biosynthesis protein [Bacteroides sp. AM07-16]
MSIKQQATKSVFWSAIERLSVQGIQFLLSIIIARLLLPTDYGLIAMLSIFMAIAQTFIDSGFANALIQKKDRTDADYSTVFYFNIVVSVVVYLLLYIVSPFIASFYDEQALTSVTRIVGLILIINSFGIVQQAKMTVVLDFKNLAIASLIAVIGSGTVGVWLAYSGYGVWALVYQSLLNNLLRVAFVWIFSGWKPILCFSRDSFRVLFAFGSKLLLSSLLHTLYTNLYTLIIGKKFSSEELGYYNRAFTLAQFPSTNLTSIIVRAVYPIQCRIQDDDEQLKTLFLKYTRISCYLIFPIMIGFCALAEPIIRILLTDRWLPAVPMLQIMCITYMWDPVMKINNSMLNVKGRSDYFLYAEVWKKIVAFSILFATMPSGVIVMCIGLFFYAFADMGIIMYYCKKVTNITYGMQFRAIYPIFLLSFTMGIGIYMLTFFNIPLYLQLVMGILCGIGYYIIVSYIFRFKELTILYDIVLKYIHRRK